MAASLVLDHLVFATRDLVRASAWLADVTGLMPEPGGSHEGLGTRNALCRFADGSYLELIGPDPAQAEPPQPRPFEIDTLVSPGVVGWCARTTDLEAFVGSVGGSEPAFTPPVAMTRDAPGGSLRWMLALPTGDNPGGVVPFVIDWGATPHPATTTAAALELVSFDIVHPAPSATAAMLDGLGVAAQVAPGPQPGIRAAVRGPGGEVVLPHGTTARSPELATGPAA